MDEVCVRLSPPLWLWTAVSRKTRLFLGFVIGDRTDAPLSRLLDEEMHWAWRDLPACTDGWQAYGRLLPADLHEVCSKQSGKTSIVEALNTKIRQRQSGMARKSCGVSWRIIDDLVERFLIFVERHKRRCLKRWRKPQPRSDQTTTRLSP